MSFPLSLASIVAAACLRRRCCLRLCHDLLPVFSSLVVRPRQSVLITTNFISVWEHLKRLFSIHSFFFLSSRVCRRLFRNRADDAATSQRSRPHAHHDHGTVKNLFTLSGISSAGRVGLQYFLC
jgi:hypothetical protein